jgi:hypothetical protein
MVYKHQYHYCNYKTVPPDAVKVTCACVAHVAVLESLNEATTSDGSIIVTGSILYHNPIRQLP